MGCGRSILVAMSLVLPTHLKVSSVSREQVEYVFACSEFVARIAQRDCEFLTQPITAAFELSDVSSAMQADVSAAEDMPALQRALRIHRNRAMARIAWRDIAGLAALDETLMAVSQLADCCVQQALAWLEPRFYKRYGRPLVGGKAAHEGGGREGMVSEGSKVDVAADQEQDRDVQRLVVLGMGKLGGYELNFSSDIDLIYVYMHDGYTAVGAAVGAGVQPDAKSGAQSISHSEFFMRLSQQLGKALNDITADGFVFRVDTRLRPFGSSGPLVASVAAMEDYYVQHGRDWERYALIKARPIAGDLAGGEALLQTLQPFIYRRYLDYRAISALRDMKAMINAEVERKSLQGDIKRGRGGIREIEFIGQAFQMIRAGREPHLQDREIRSVLDKLAAARHLSLAVVEALQTAYAFLRKLENRLQQYRDQQTHALPKQPEDQARLALAMDFPEWEALCAAIEQQRHIVREQFDAVFARDDRGADEVSDATHWCSEALAIAGCEAAGLLSASDAEGNNGSTDDAAQQTLRQWLRALFKDRRYQQLTLASQEQVQRLLAYFAQEVGQVKHPLTAMQRMLALLENIMQRSVYLELLSERPDARTMLARLASASPWIMDTLAKHPILLDELLDADDLVQVPTTGELNQQLAQQLTDIDVQDLDLQMDVLRQFQKVQMLHVAAADVLGNLPIMRVSDALTNLAEAVLQQALVLAWQQTVIRMSPPSHASLSAPGMAIIAYGKLGGIELNYSSDLDIVFLLSDDIQQSDSPFYAKLVQRLMHLLQTRTTAGVCYEVDTRLRPNGRSGLLVTRLQAFAEYQRQSAWTWEHQALVRARFVAGDERVGAGFALQRQALVSQTRDVEKLRNDVVEMRQKMRQELDKTNEQQFDLKQGAGGITDIEFMVQHAVLQWSGSYPELSHYQDNVRVLQALGVTPERSSEVTQQLADAYLALRRRMHELALQNLPARVPAGELLAERAFVQACWQGWMQIDEG